ncbi:MAG: hypothetical protein AB1758_20340, partial [Candidatus Eremiobacterota bacterium]
MPHEAARTRLTLGWGLYAPLRQALPLPPQDLAPDVLRPAPGNPARNPRATPDPVAQVESYANRHVARDPERA